MGYKHSAPMKRNNEQSNYPKPPFKGCIGEFSSHLKELRLIYLRTPILEDQILVIFVKVNNY